MMLGFLLARAGVDVVVLEKHADFFRDFRGDTVHPSTLEMMYELGLLDEFLKVPHQKIERLSMQVGANNVSIVDFTHLPTHCKFVALMPQWDFLNFLAEQGKRYKTFDLHMKTEATDLIEDSGRIVGVRAECPGWSSSRSAPISWSAATAGIRQCAPRRASYSDDYGAPMDVLWFRVTRKATDDAEEFGHVEAGRMMVMLDRGDYWQCAYVIPKGGIDRVEAEGIDAFRAARGGDVAACLPTASARSKSFDDVKLLTVAVDRLRQWWRPGLICIGDAAHAMSPIGGVGINLAVQDAVAAANRLAAPLKARSVSDDDLAAIEKRRTFPVRATQWLQLTMQNRIIAPCARQHRTAEAAAHVQIVQRLSAPAPHPGAPAGPRFPARACADTRCRGGRVGHLVYALRKHSRSRGAFLSAPEFC